MTIVPESPRKPFDMRLAIEAIADIGSIFELKPAFAQNMLTLLARMDGRPVGFVANQPSYMAGAIDINATDKAARFISLCDAFHLPLIFLIDTPGFLPGPDSERAGLARHSGKLLYEIGNSTVTKIAVVTRKAYGLGAIAMSGGAHDADGGGIAWLPGPADTPSWLRLVPTLLPDTRPRVLPAKSPHTAHRARHGAP